MAWITAGITFSVLHAPQSVKETKHPNYQPARILFLKNQFPSVANLLNHPAPTQTELPYTLYSMHCHLILQALKTIQRQDKLRTAPVQQICQLITDGRPPLDALNFCIAPYLKFDETIQQWYEREVIRESTRGRRPLTSQHIMQRVQKLERVPLVLPGQALKREKRLIALDELPKTLKKYGMDNHIVYQLTREFFELMSNAPPLLQPALQRYIEALQRLSQGKTWGFGRRIRKARAELVHSCDHQNRIVSYMNNLEGNTLTLESLFPHYYKAWQSSNSQRRELDPDLHIYLDQLQQ